MDSIRQSEAVFFLWPLTGHVLSVPQDGQPGVFWLLKRLATLPYFFWFAGLRAAIFPAMQYPDVKGGRPFGKT